MHIKVLKKVQKKLEIKLGKGVFFMNKMVSENVKELTSKELSATNGGGNWQDIGEWVGYYGKIWGNTSEKQWEICQKNGIHRRVDC